MWAAIRPILWLAASGALCIPGSGQTIYFEDFASGAPGWTFGPPLCCGVQWNVDALPANVPGGPFFSAPASLNYNNDVNHQGGPGLGWVLSPPIDLSVATGTPVVTFWCNNQSAEPTCDPHESQHLVVVGQTSGCYGRWWYATHQCQFDRWHPHLMVLDASWGAVQLRFEFDSDGLFDQAPGWFVDDVGVYDSPAPTPYCTSTDATCTPSVDWGGALASSTDPTPCWITCKTMPPQTIGLLFYGLSGPAALPFLDGTLCVASPLRRTPVQNTGGSSSCTGYLSLDFNRLIRSGGDPALLPGQEVHAQWWIRYTSLPSQAALSNAIAFTILP